MAKNAQQYIKNGLITQSDFSFLAELDPSKTKKYLSFIVKAYLANINLDLLRNRVSEYDTLLERNQVDRKDINSFRTFDQFDEYVQKYNSAKSTRELKRAIKKEADIILDTDDIFIVCPLSHESSCLYGAGTRWCTTSVNSIHFERYFFERLITFYYIQVRSDEIKKRLKQDLWKVAVVVHSTDKIEVYDAADHRLGCDNSFISQTMDADDLFKILGVDKSLFIPHKTDERIMDSMSYKLDDGIIELNLLGLGFTVLPDTIGNMIKLESLILSENKIEVLPESIGLLTNLKTLYLFHNKLTSLPQSLENLTKLQWLGLTGNNISRRTIRELKRKLPSTRIYC